MERDQSIQQSAKVDHSLKTAVIFGVRFGLAVLAGGTAVSGCGIGKSSLNNIGGESDYPISGAEVAIPQYSDDQLQAEGLNPREQTAYLNYLIQSCQTAPTSRISSLNKYLDSFFNSRSSVAEASELEAGMAETPDDFVKCTQDVEAKRPFFSNYGIKVEDWHAQDNVLGVDTIANWRTRLPGEMKARGFEVSQASVNALTGESIRFTFIKPNGEVAIFTAVILDDKSEVDRRRAADDLTAHWSGEDVWMALDLVTRQVMGTLKACDNKGVPVPFEQLSPTASATAILATATSTNTSVPPTSIPPAEQPSATPQTLPSPTREVTATPQPTPIMPTSTPVIPASTHVPPTFTSVPTWEASATPQTNPLTPTSIGSGPTAVTGRVESTPILNPDPTAVVVATNVVNTAIPAPTVAPTREPAATPGGR